jgi:hypothetical protein
MGSVPGIGIPFGWMGPKRRRPLVGYEAPKTGGVLPHAVSVPQHHLPGLRVLLCRVASGARPRSVSCRAVVEAARSRRGGARDERRLSVKERNRIAHLGENVSVHTFDNSRPMQGSEGGDATVELELDKADGPLLNGSR